MMPEWITSLINWIQIHPKLAGLLIFIIAFTESIAFFGILVPGAVILFALGTLIAFGALDLTSALIWCTAGAILGDALSYYLGRKYQQQLTTKWPFKNNQSLVTKGQQFFKKYGLMSIFMGRFIGPIRPIIPIVTGMMSMPARKFLPINISACILWSPAYLLPGVVFGHSLDVAADVAFRLILLMAIIIFLIWISIKAIYFINNHLIAPSVNFIRWLFARAQRKQGIWYRLISWLEDPLHPNTGSLGPLILIGWLSIITLIILIILKSQGDFPADELLYQAINPLRSPLIDRIMAAFATLGHPYFILTEALAIFTWLLYRKRPRAGLTWLIGLLVGMAITQIWNNAVNLPNQPDYWFNLTGAKAVVLFLLFAILNSTQLPKKPRFHNYFIGTLLSLIALFAQFYLTGSTLYALTSGCCIALLWVAIVGIIYRLGQRRHYLAKPVKLIFRAIILLGLGLGFFQYHQYILSHFNIEKAEIIVTQDELTNSMMTSPLQSLVFVGNLQETEVKLLLNGWETTSKFNWKSALRLLTPEPTIEQLPILPKAKHGGFEKLLMEKTDSNNEKFILRLWQEPLKIEKNQQTMSVYSGYLAKQHSKNQLWFFNYRTDQMLANETLQEQITQLANQNITFEIIENKSNLY